jgi:hypothetical protein
MTNSILLILFYLAVFLPALAALVWTMARLSQ